MPTFLECQRCAVCCRWPGWVRGSAAFLGPGEREFIARHTRLRPDRRGLALLEKANGECDFLEGRDCRIQPVKPQQCRDFPNGWNFPGFERFCRAVPREVSPDEWQQLIRVATGGELFPLFPWPRCGSRDRRIPFESRKTGPEPARQSSLRRRFSFR